MEELPREMQLAVLRQADAVTRGRAERVCSDWRSLARQTWKAVAKIAVKGPVTLPPSWP